MGNGGGCGEGSFHRMEAVGETVTAYRLLFTNSWGGRFWKCTELASKLAPLCYQLSFKRFSNILHTI